MVASARRRDSERGETLIELLTAMSILGITVVAIVAGIGTSIVMSDIHRKQATAGAVVRTYAETIEAGLVASGKPYLACATPAQYAPASFATPTGYAAVVKSVKYWNGTVFSTTCSASTDSGVQRLTLAVTSSDSKVEETLDLVIRKPCLTVAACV